METYSRDPYGREYYPRDPYSREAMGREDQYRFRYAVLGGWGCMMIPGRGGRSRAPPRGRLLPLRGLRGPRIGLGGGQGPAWQAWRPCPHLILHRCLRLAGEGRSLGLASL